MIGFLFDGGDYNLISSLLNLMAVVATFASGFLLVKFGRKPIIQFGTIFLGVGNLIVAMGVIKLNQTAAPIGLCVYLAVFGLTLGPLIWLYIPEIVSENIVPLTTAVNWACASIVIIIVPIVG